jgi:hypothetical protein
VTDWGAWAIAGGLVAAVLGYGAWRFRRASHKKNGEDQ